jgi:hypothetical protein
MLARFGGGATPLGGEGGKGEKGKIVTPAKAGAHEHRGQKTKRTGFGKPANAVFMGPGFRRDD